MIRRAWYEIVVYRADDEGEHTVLVKRTSWWDAYWTARIFRKNGYDTITRRLQTKRWPPA